MNLEIIVVTGDRLSCIVYGIWLMGYGKLFFDKRYTKKFWALRFTLLA